VFLKILLTHPRFQRRGAGSALARWGVEQARAMGVCTTVFASPMGLALYRRLGFREVGRFRVQCEGEGEFLEIPALVRGRGEVGGMREAEGVRRAEEGGGMGGGDGNGLELKRGLGGAAAGRRVVVGEGWGVGPGAVCA
jgi:hypothetical protein